MILVEDIRYPLSGNIAGEGRISLTTKSDSLSHMISCDTSGIINVPLTSVPSLAEPVHFNTILQSKIVINLNESNVNPEIRLLEL